MKGRGHSIEQEQDVKSRIVFESAGTERYDRVGIHRNRSQSGYSFDAAMRTNVNTSVNVGAAQPEFGNGSLSNRAKIKHQATPSATTAKTNSYDVPPPPPTKIENFEKTPSALTVEGIKKKYGFSKGSTPAKDIYTHY